MAKFQVGDRVTAKHDVNAAYQVTVVPSLRDDAPFPVRTVTDSGTPGLWKEEELRLVSRKERRPQVVTLEELLPGDVVLFPSNGYVTVAREVPQYPVEPSGDVFAIINARRASATGKIMVGKFGSMWYTFTYRDGYAFQGTWAEVCERFEVESIRAIYKEEK